MFRTVLLTLTLSAAALAQTVPGTFTTVAPEHVVGSTVPIVSTPTLTLSNGFSPAAVTMPQTLVAEQPQPYFVSGAMPQGEEASAKTEASQSSAPDFDFAKVNPQSAFSVGASGPSLGEISKHSKRGHVQAHKTYTNEDIERLISELPENGANAAKFSNGQPIVDHNQDGFSPMSGIANMPEVTNPSEGMELAGGETNPTNRNPAEESQNSATASNADQGRSAGQQATTPSTDISQPANGNAGNQQLPASDSNPH